MRFLKLWFIYAIVVAAFFAGFTHLIIIGGIPALVHAIHNTTGLLVVWGVMSALLGLMGVTLHPPDDRKIYRVIYPADEFGPGGCSVAMNYRQAKSYAAVFNGKIERI